MKQVNSNVALIDKVHLYGFRIVKIDDFTKLQNAGIITVKENGLYYMETEGKRYSSLTIEQNDYFDTFSCYAWKNHCVVTKLQISVGDETSKNLCCMTMVELRKRIAGIQEYLATAYGIHVDFSSLKVKYMEINKTFPLLRSGYDRAITLMMLLMPASLRLKGENPYYGNRPKKVRGEDSIRRKETSLLTSGKCGITVTIYDKTEQLEKSQKKKKEQKSDNTKSLPALPEEHYYRFEIRLNHQDKVKKVLGTNLISQITDQQINCYFNNFIQKNVKKTYEVYQKNSKKEVSEIMQDFYAEYKYAWTDKFLAYLYDTEINCGGIPLILDIEEILPLVDNLKLKDRKAKYRIKKSLLDMGNNKHKRHLRVLYSDDHIKYEEILSYLL